jgi:RecJ-like exonuclease
MSKRDKYIHFRLPRHVRERVEVAARMEDRSMSAWLSVTLATANLAEIRDELMARPLDERAKPDHLGAMIKEETLARLQQHTNARVPLSWLILRAVEKRLGVEA